MVSLFTLDAASWRNCLGRSARPARYRTGTSYPNQNRESGWYITNRGSQLETYRSPDVEHDIGGPRQGFPSTPRILCPVPYADLGEGQDDDDDSKKHVEVVLQRTASAGGFGLPQVDDVADQNLHEIEDEDRESELLNYGLETHAQKKRTTIL